MKAWLTPDTVPVGRACRILKIPDSPEFTAPVTGALLSLTEVWNWEKFGALTPEETAEIYWQMVNEYLNNGTANCMIGVIFSYVNENPPEGSLPCDGGIYNRVDYQQLFDRIDPMYVLSPDTFTVPDLRSRVPLGAGTGTGLSAYAVNQIGGEENHVLTVSELATHSHTDAGHAHSEITAVPAVIPPGEIPIPLSAAVPSVGATGSGFASIQNTGDSAPHNNIQPYTAVKYGVWWR